MGRRVTGIQSFSELWIRHEQIYHDVFRAALNELNVDNRDLSDESRISNKLNVELKKTCFEKYPEINYPKWENPIGASSSEEIFDKKINKRPDFSCVLKNTQALTPEEGEISLHVECKRLGRKKGNWNLNRNYYEEGMKRFDLESHKYGERANSGFMIGYIIDFEPGYILENVNKYIPANIAPLEFPFKNKIETCETKYTRKVVTPKKFRLKHIWIDLRD